MTINDRTDTSERLKSGHGPTAVFKDSAGGSRRQWLRHLRRSGRVGVLGLRIWEGRLVNYSLTESGLERLVNEMKETLQRVE